MCGIAGFVGPGDRPILKRMTDAIRHRGPDAEGHWVDEAAGVFLGHRRLSIVDLSGGAQPMWTRNGRIGVVFNGEIYNHEELRAELRAFLDCVRTRQTPKVDGLAGRRALELADQVMAGILEHGRRVQLGAFASPQGK